MKFDVFLYTFEGKILIWVSLLLKRLAGQVASESTQALLMIPPAPHLSDALRITT